MKKFFQHALALAALGTVAAAAHAAGPDSTNTPNVYVGGGLSFGRASGLGGKIDDALANQGYGSSSSADKSSTNPNLKLGYRISPNFAVEATYDRIGSMDVSSVVNGDAAAGHWKSQGLGLHALAIAPLNDQWSVYGRLGVERWHTRMDLGSTDGGPTALANSGNSTSLVLGAGASYAISRNVDATAELVHYTHVGDAAATGRTGVNQVNVGVLYHFL